MASHFGVTAPVITAPTGAFIHESTSDKSVEIATVRNSLGVTKVAKAKPMITEKLAIKGKGPTDFSLVVAADVVEGATLVTEAKQGEKNSDFPDFEIAAERYSNPAP